MAKKDNKANKNVKENNKNKKSFFKGFKAELKKVIWPTPKQLVNNTVAVITIVLITALIVFVLDLTFETINEHGVDKIKGVVESTQDDSTDTSEETDNQEENSTTENTESTDNNEENANNEENTSSDATNTESTDSTETNTNNAENNIQE